ncbi:interleukin 1 receptor accessory protein precursor-like [Scleropages formosus]|uniref:Interleukin 1 receptor accessory protein-like n=1 Tax=Scleropages formosus TaxID=113540 RepID=A0A0P7WMW0_SCLFO|nr:interleukin 1 receptor accessory protein precursor-like [Scleropages formosus]
MDASNTVFSPPSAACQDVGTSSGEMIQVYGGEASVLRCPLYHTEYAQGSRFKLDWYWTQSPETAEQPVPVDHMDSRISREGNRLWFHPVSSGDAGHYICVLSNRTCCVKVTVRLKVLQRPEGMCVPQPPGPSVRVDIPVEEGKTLSCPDLQDFTHPNRSLSVQWFHNCKQYEWGIDREKKGQNVVIHLMREIYAGNYTCVVTYTFRGEEMKFTRVVAVRPVCSEAKLKCQVFLPHLDGEQPKPEVWWEVSGQTLGQLGDPRFSSTSEVSEDRLGDRTVENVLQIQTFSSQDLNKEYSCFAQNSRNRVSRVALLRAEEYLPHVELGLGLAVPTVIVLVLFVVYHVFQLELLLLYRSRCVCHRVDPDGKEFDVYISYARNSAEEQFVHMTLRRVLENELGYKVCIFDRDSLPGGTITDETLSFVGRSRCLIVVLSPAYALQGTQALLELKAGLDSMALGGDLRVILVQYQPVSRSNWVQELRRARVALALIRWKGEKSAHLSSHFWKQLQVELPIKWKRDAPSINAAHKQYILTPSEVKSVDSEHDAHTKSDGVVPTQITDT